MHNDVLIIGFFVGPDAPESGYIYGRLVIIFKFIYAYPVYINRAWKFCFRHNGAPVGAVCSPNSRTEDHKELMFKGFPFFKMMGKLRLIDSSVRGYIHP